MCGFVGFINGGDTQRDESVLHSMTDAIRHRGPDDADYYMDGSISLGFRRLSIIDLEGGRQPILNEDESKVLLFNGEIYNFQEIKRDLLAAGHVFKTATDSEVLLTVMRNTVQIYSISCVGCLLSSFGTGIPMSCSAPGTFLESSPSTTQRWAAR